MNEIHPGNTIFVLISFEGPDQYSQAGGLGVRVAELSQALAEQGYFTHVFFVGDPYRHGEEHRVGGRLILHRWCQWISHYYPKGCYQGEEMKLPDFHGSLADYVANVIVPPAYHDGKLTAVIGEDWHAAQTLIHLSDMLHLNGMRDRCLFTWNANNVFSFHRIDWPRLQFVSDLTTVSRYMKFTMTDMGLDEPLVIPNGIPRRFLEPVHPDGARYLRQVLETPMLLAKIGRYDPAKRWLMAIDAVWHLKQMGGRPTLIMRGGLEPHRAQVLGRAVEIGLTVKQLSLGKPSIDEIYSALAQVRDADVIELNFFVPEEFLRILYYASDAVLANSGHEPFGIVGLEVMACGGIVFTGATGEDYARSFQNSMVVQTGDPQEIASYMAYLYQHPEMGRSIREQGRISAESYLWEAVIEEMRAKLFYLANKNHIAIP
ncbi:MAG: glycosyltransferase [Armatimonadetes bacterium]|nr:glycosyltransferase [Armatimonadota bacterium]